MADHAKPEGASLPLSLYLSSPHDCPYLPDRLATDVFTQVSSISAADYALLMDHGFRRSGRLIYRPVCTECRECRPIRVPVASFRASRSQRRVARRNQNVHMSVATPQPTDEKWRLYGEYLRFQHDGKMAGDRDDFERFLYDSPTETLELEFRVAGRLVGVSIVDACPDCWSSVYFYFDPAEAKRSLGVYSAICEIAECGERGLPFWYAGFYIRDCHQMNYKAAYRPFELLGPDGVWRAPADDVTPRE